MFPHYTVHCVTLKHPKQIRSLYLPWRDICDIKQNARRVYRLNCLKSSPQRDVSAFLCTVVINLQHASYELFASYSLPDVNGMTKSRRMKSEGHMTRIAGTRTTKFRSENLKGRGHLGDLGVD